MIQVVVILTPISNVGTNPFVLVVHPSFPAGTLKEFEDQVRRLAEAAHAGELKPEELRGGTFTVTSAGKAAGLFVTPLINHPEVAILGVHRIEDRPVVRDNEVVVRRMGNVSVTFDHRVVDGKRAAEFGLAVIAQLELRSL